MDDRPLIERFRMSRDGHVTVTRTRDGTWLYGVSARMLQIPTFVRWLQAQANRDDPIGDFARDTRDDPKWFHGNANPSLKEIMSYLRLQHQILAYPYDGSVAQAVYAAYQEWHDAGGRYRDLDKPIGRKLQTKPVRKQTISIGPLALRFAIFKRDHYRCQICGRNAQDDAVKLEMDHKIPRAKGGSDDPSNLWTLCFDCNRGKRDNETTNRHRPRSPHQSPVRRQTLHGRMDRHHVPDERHAPPGMVYKDKGVDAVTTPHTCHAIGCERIVKERIFMCYWHWSRLPVTLKRRIWATYREGQEIDKNPSLEWLDAAHACRTWLQERGL